MSVAAAFPTNYTQPQTPSESQMSDKLSPSNSIATTPTTTDINSNTTGRTPNDLDEEDDEVNSLKDIKKGTPPNVYKGNPDGVTVLMYACQQDRETDVRSLLTQKPTMVEARDRTGKTALHYCAENDTPTCADVLLNHDRSLIDVQDNDGYSTLHLAVIAGNNLFIKYLISKGAELTLLDSEMHSVVHWAVVCGELEALDILLEAGADPSTADIHGAHPVHYAAQMCGPDQQNVIPGEPPGGGPRVGLLTLKKLLSKGVPVTVVDQDGRPPLLWAASSGSDEAILALVNAGASFEAADKDGLTALHCAASRGHVDCLETLANLCGAEVDVIDANGCSPLFYAVTLGHAECTKLLLKYGCHPNRQDRKGRTPAHCGAAKGQLETLRLLASHGGDMWIRNIRGDLPLHEAVQSTRKDLVIWLLNQKPEAVNAANNDGKCPLHIAALNDNIEMCKVLLDLQASVNPIMRTSKGQLATPLDAALHRGNRNCAKYLQLHGAVPAHKLTDKNALQRALALASVGQDLDSSQYLKSSTGSLPSVMTDEGVQTDEKLRLSKESQANGAKNHRSSRQEDHTTLTTTTNKRHQKQNRRHRRYEEDAAYSSEEYDTDDYYDDDDEDENEENDLAGDAKSSNKTDAQKKQRSKMTSEKYLTTEKSSKRHQKERKRSFGEKQKHTGKAAVNGDQSVTKTIKKTANGGELTTKTVKTTKRLTSRRTVEYEEGESDYTDEDENEDMPTKTAKRAEKTILVRGGGKEAQNYEAADVSRRHREENRHQKREKVSKRTSERLVSRVEEHYEGSEYGHPSLEASEASGGKDSGFSEHYGSVKGVQDGRQSREHLSGTTSRSEVESRDQTRGSSRTASRNDEPTAKNGIRLEAPNQQPDLSTRNKPKKTKDAAKGSRKVAEPKINEEFSDSEEETTDARKGREKLSNGVEDRKQMKGATTEKSGPKLRKNSASGKSKNHRPRLTTPSKASIASKNSFKGKPSKAFKQLQQGQKLADNGEEASTDAAEGNPTGSIELAMATRNGHIPAVNPNDPIAVRNKVRKANARYELERKIFQELLELKRLQVRTGKANEQVLVKRLVDTYKKEGLLGVKPYDGPYAFASFEKHLYDQLKSIQNPNLLKGLALKPPKDQEGNSGRPEAIDSAATKRELSTWMQGRVAALMAADDLAADADPHETPSQQCTHRTHTCHHAAHAYTGVPCAAYITKPNHHHNIKGPARPFLPKIERQHGGGAATEPVDLKNFDPTRPLTLELNHGGTRQLIEFPANKLDKNRKYHVTFTIKPTTPIDEELASNNNKGEGVGGGGTPPLPAPLRRPMPAGVSVQELQKQLSTL